MTESGNKPAQHGLLVVGGFILLLALFVAILWFAWAWENEKAQEKERRQADLSAKIEQIRKEHQLQKLVSDLAEANKPPAGFIKITKDTPLREGVRIYEHKLGIRPKYVGTVESVGDRGVFVLRKESDIEKSLGLGGIDSQIPKFIEFTMLYDQYLAR